MLHREKRMRTMAQYLAALEESHNLPDDLRLTEQRGKKGYFPKPDVTEKNMLDREQLLAIRSAEQDRLRGNVRERIEQKHQINEESYLQMTPKERDEYAQEIWNDRSVYSLSTQIPIEQMGRLAEYRNPLGVLIDFYLATDYDQETYIRQFESIFAEYVVGDYWDLEPPFMTPDFDQPETERSPLVRYMKSSMQDMSLQEQIQFIQDLGLMEEENQVPEDQRITKYDSGCFIPKDGVTEHDMERRHTSLYELEAERKQLSDNIHDRLRQEYDANHASWQKMSPTELIDCAGYISQVQRAFIMAREMKTDELKPMARFKNPLQVLTEFITETRFMPSIELLEPHFERFFKNRSDSYELAPAFEAPNFDQPENQPNIQQL